MRVSLAAAAALAAAVAVSPPPAAAQPGRSDVQEGNRLYREGRYDEAHQMYLEALRAAPDSPVIRFNDANALYQTDEFARAADAYRGALEADEAQEADGRVLDARAWYNLGNALYRQQQVEDALEAYKEALRRNPGDADAKHNLEVALERLRQQERRRQSDGSDPDSGQEQDQREAGADEPAPSPGEQPRPQPSGERPEEESPEDRQGQEPEQEDGPQPEGEPDEPPNGEAEAQPRPGEMSREEAERLLQAISEDPGEIRRQRRPADPGRPARRPW